MATMLSGKYRVSDCEHYGDIESVVSMLRKNGCTVLNAFWDGKDCGEAYVSFEFPESEFVNIYETLGSCVEYDVDINNYVSFSEKVNYKKTDVKSMVAMRKSVEDIISDGFEKKQLYLLYFEIKRNVHDVNEIISSIMKEYGVKTKVICYSAEYEGSNVWNIRVLFEAHCEVGKFTELKLLTSMFMKRIGIYGTLHTTHRLAHYNMGIYEKRVDAVVNKAELEYHDSRYEKVKVPYNEYAFEMADVIYLRTSIDKNGHLYFL